MYIVIIVLQLAKSADFLILILISHKITGLTNLFPSKQPKID